MTALAVTNLDKSFGGLRVTSDVSLRGGAGRAAARHRPQRRGQDHAVQPDHRRAAPRPRLQSRSSTRDITRVPSRRRFHLGMARTYQIITLFPGRDPAARPAPGSLLGLSRLRWNPLVRLAGRRELIARARETLARVGLQDLAERPLRETAYGRAPPRRDRHGAGPESARAPARRAVRRALGRGATRRLAAGHRDPARGDDRDYRARHGHRFRPGRPHHRAGPRAGDRRRHRRMWCATTRKCARCTLARRPSACLSSTIHTYYGESHILQGVSLSERPGGCRAAGT